MSEVLAHSQAAIRQGSQSFATAARLFSRPVRESAVMLYAWCRHCDDVIDGQEGGGLPASSPSGAPEERLARLRAETARVFRGAPATDPVFAAFAEVVRRHGIAEHEALDHLAGFEMDVTGRTYRTFDDTLSYCYHVAGVVGLMMGRVMGVADLGTLDRACDLGIAFQLTNMARDLVEDARQGRVYLPADWLADAGLTAADLTELHSRDALATLAARLVDEAEPYYRSAAVGVRALPRRSAWAVSTALGVYRAIGVEVRRRGPDAWTQRVSTSRLQKLGHVGRGAFHAMKLLPAPSVSRRRLWTRPRP